MNGTEIAAVGIPWLSVTMEQEMIVLFLVWNLDRKQFLVLDFGINVCVCVRVFVFVSLL